MIDRLTETEQKLDIMHDVLIEIRDELQDGWYDQCLLNLEDNDKKKRKVTPAEEYYSTEYPNLLPPYEAPKNYER